MRNYTSDELELRSDFELVKVTEAQTNVKLYKWFNTRGRYQLVYDREANLTYVPAMIEVPWKGSFFTLTELERASPTWEESFSALVQWTDSYQDHGRRLNNETNLSLMLVIDDCFYFPLRV